MSLTDDIHNAMMKCETDYSDWAISVQIELLEAICDVVERRNASTSNEAVLSLLIGEMEQGAAIMAKREERMRTALCFYGHPDTYCMVPNDAEKGYLIPIEKDKGEIAREALVDFT